jgi:hypothetical protein
MLNCLNLSRKVRLTPRQRMAQWEYGKDIEYLTYYLSLAQINGHLSAKQKLAQGIDES